MIGIVFATKAEAAPFLALVTATEEEGTPYKLFSFSAGVLIICGIGPEAASAATEYLLTAHHLSHIINPGICGALTDNATVGRLYRVAEASLLNPSSMTHEPPISPAHDLWDDLSSARLISSPEPIFDAARRQQLSVCADIVDMEGAAIAATCERHSIPCYLLKGVSDFAGDDDREHLQRNLAMVSARVAQALHRELSALLPREMSLPQRLASFVKAEHTLFSLPLLFTGAWLGAGGNCPSWQILGLIMAAGCGARAFGMALNRILDRRLDALNPRTSDRLLPRGKLSLRQAWGVVAAGFLLYMVACILISPLCVWLSPLPLLPLATYSFLKRFTSFCHFGIGLCLGLAPLGAFVAVANRLPLEWPILLLGIFSFCWISGFDIIYALQDVESDRLTGVYSLPSIYGLPTANTVAAGLHGLAWLAIIVVVILSGNTWARSAACGVLAIALILANTSILPLRFRFFPLSAVAGVVGATVPLL